MPITGKGAYRYDNGSDTPDGPGQALRLAQDVSRNLDPVDDAAGLAAVVVLGAVDGMHVYQIDIKQWWLRASGAWVAVRSDAPPRCRVTKSAAQSTSVTPGTATAVLWDLETYDTAAMHSTVTNTSRITVPTGGDGYYDVMARVRATTSTGTLTVQFAKNGTPIADSVQFGLGNATQNPFPQVSDTLFLAAGDYLEVFVSSNTASVALTVGNCAFAANSLGPV